MSNKGNIFVISAPSGTGKSTLVQRLCAMFPELIHSVSCTTRKPREYEQSGREYEFVSHEEFERRIRSGYFVEWAKVYDAYYGTPKKPLEEALSQGKHVITDIDVQGGMAVKKLFPEAITIFILPPDVRALEQRLNKRGSNSVHEIEMRLTKAQEEMKYKDRYDYCIVNDDLEKAVSKLRDIFSSSMGRVKK